MELIIASHNSHKIKEFKEILPESFSVLSLEDLKIENDIEETGSTLEENARIKAEFIAQKFQIPCIADDTGLEIASLKGRPGAYSARYAGEPPDSAENIKKVLKEMQGLNDRGARFRTVLAFYDLKEFHLFEGIVEGEIISGQRGEEGFGYDSIFLPKGGSKTFAEMSSGEKNKISHRGRALESFKQFSHGL